MALVLADRVQETTATTGTGTITLAGAVSGYQSFAAIGNGNTTYYTITSGTDWEVGIGTYSTTGPTLARTTILSSSASGAAITLAGTSTVFATYPAEKSVNQDASGNVGINTTPGVRFAVSGSQYLTGAPETQGLGGADRTSLYINPGNVANPAGSVYGVANNISVSSSTSGLYATGYGGLFKVTGSGSVPLAGLTLAGFRATVVRSGSGDVAGDGSIYGAFIDIDASANSTTGVTNNTNGLYLTGSIGSGTVNNWYEAYLAGTSGAGTINAKWGIYQANAAHTNFFAGKVGINTSSPGTSTLAVAGIISSSATISGSGATGAFSYGTLGYSDTNNILIGQTSVNSYSQMVMQNTNAGATASANYNVSNNATTATTNYGEFGINSSGFTGSGAFNAASAVYLTSTTGDLAIGTTTSNAIHFVVNGGATDAATISSAGLLTANSFASSSAAITGGSVNSTTIGATTASTGAFTTLGASGAVTLSPASANVVLSPTGTGVVTVNPATAGTINNCSVGVTTPAAGAFTTLNWTGVKYTAAGSAQGAAITDYFASTISLDAASVYNIECVVVFSKATAGTVIWTWTCSSAPTFISSMVSEIPITGFATGGSVTAATIISGTASSSASTTAVHTVSGSLTTAVNHIFRFQVMVMTNAATTIQLRSTQSAGTLTPQAGSFMRASKVL